MIRNPLKKKKVVFTSCWKTIDDGNKLIAKLSSIYRYKQNILVTGFHVLYGFQNNEVGDADFLGHPVYIIPI